MDSSTNLLAKLVLLCFPLIGWMIFKRKPIELAIIYTIIGGYLFLPLHTRFDLPLFPILNKGNIPSIVTYLLVGVFSTTKIKIFHKSSAINFLIVIYLFSPFVTAMNNSQPIVIADSFRYGMNVFSPSALSLLMIQFFVLMPLIVGRQYLSSDEAIKNILRIFLLVGVVYTLFVLWEVRMSPRLHTQIYGVHAGAFNQQKRQDGFRAMVMIGHGLLVSLFLVIVFISAIYAWIKREKFFGVPAIALLAYLFAVVILNKTYAATIYAVFCLILLRMLSMSVQKTVIVLLSVTVILYPIFRVSGWIPTESVTSKVAEISLDRAASLQFRFDNESILLDRANIKPLFGWGGYGRNRVYDEEGNDISVTDGEWVITYGTFGWVGYLAKYGLLVLPIMMIVKRGVFRDKEKLHVVALAVILLVVLLDNLINAGIRPWTWLVAGALIGYAENGQKSLKNQEQEA